MQTMRSWTLALASLFVGSVVGGLALLPFALNGQGQAPVSPAVPREMTSYRDVVKKVLPAVVSIESRAKPASKVKQPKKRVLPDDQQIPEEFRKFFEDQNRQQAAEPDDTPELGFGSGFLVDPKGVILTNFHVVDGADQVIVELKDGRKYTSKDIHVDGKTDLAI